MSDDRFMIYEPEQLTGPYRTLPEEGMIFSSQGAALDYKHHLQTLHPDKVYIVLTNPKIKASSEKGRSNTQNRK
jgi:hypothetical protein